MGLILFLPIGCVFNNRNVLLVFIVNNIIFMVITIAFVVSIISSAIVIVDYEVVKAVTINS